jgi:hypothetical protein
MGKKFLLPIILVIMSTQNTLMSNRIHTKGLKTQIIKHIHIIGERCSGTNFVAQLLLQNIAGISVSNQFTVGPYGWKHGFVSDAVIAKGNNCLFVHVYRNPYDWVRSFHREPYHAHQSLINISFSEFIRREWHATYGETNSKVKKNDPRYETEMIEERNPTTKQRFENVMRLRTEKLKHFESLRNRLPYFFSAAYEVVNNDPEFFVKNFAAQFSLQLKQKYTPVSSYKGLKKTGIYKKKQYSHFKEDDLNLINSWLNWKFENRLGYEINKDDSCSRILFPQ